MAAILLVASLALPALADQTDDLTSKSMEDLMNMQVTSVSKKSEKLSRTPAAVFVISSQDIRNSGATNIPDLLRMVPGLEVAQINANTWAITARGLNGRFANELLVMVDGRSVYSVTTGGVFWDVLDMPLEDIERIEVIRGPGGSIWGANAVNGVINIISKKASETRGAMIVAGAGNTDAFSTLQYGAKLGHSTDYRIFAKYFDFNRLPNLPGQNAADDWHVLRGGFRADHSFSQNDTLAVQGDLYDGKEGLNTSFGPSLFAPGIGDAYNVTTSGGFVQGVWKHAPSDRSDISLQLSYDGYERNDPLHEGRKTFDVQFQHHFLAGSHQDFIWGLENRYSVSNSNGNFFVSLIPSHIATDLFSSFAQDEITLLPDHLYVTVGTKLEHNRYTGFNIMPTGRIAWTPSPRQTLWAAISRAPRTPADSDASIRVNFATIPSPSGIPLVLSLLGNKTFADETLNSFEAGYRTQVTSHTALDFAFYYNNYDNQQTEEPASPFVELTPAPAHLVVPLIFRNLMHGESHGFELAGRQKLTDRWTLNPSYAFEQIHMHLSPSSHDSTSVSGAQGSSPVNSIRIRSEFSVSRSLDWSTSASFTGRLTDPAEASYTRLDTGLIWQFAESSSLAIVGQNLLRDHHSEFLDSSASVQTTLVKRSGYIEFTVKF